MSITHRLRIVISLLFGVVFIGTLGFEFIEGWSLLDSFYMTLVTISTVGYQEIHPLSQAGRAFTAGLIIVGVGATLYGLTVIFELLVEGQIRGLLGKRRMERGLRRMKDHFVVCGYGRVGRRVVAELRRRGKKVVVIESRPECQERLSEDKMHFISGDATDDKVLEASGIKTARGLILALPNQAANVLITLSARHCNPHIRIVGRADEDRSAERRVGKECRSRWSPSH